MPWDEYRELAENIADAILHVQPHGRTWCNVTPIVPTFPLAKGASGRSRNSRTSLLTLWDSALAQTHQRWDYVAWTIVGRGPGCSWGSWESPSGPNMRGEWETIIVDHTGPTWHRDTPEAFTGSRDRNGGWLEMTSNVWKIKPEARGYKTGNHPAPFPVAIPARCIRLSTWPGETVLDPFMGSGTTMCAAKSLGRRAIGFELSERYCEIAATRLSQGVLPFGDVIQSRSAVRDGEEPF